MSICYHTNDLSLLASYSYNDLLLSFLNMKVVVNYMHGYYVDGHGLVSHEQYFTFCQVAS